MYTHGGCSSNIMDNLHALSLEMASRIYNKIGDHGCDKSQFEMNLNASSIMKENRSHQQCTLITIELTCFLAWCRGHQAVAQAWSTRLRLGRRITHDDNDAHSLSAQQIVIMQVQKVLCLASKETLQIDVDTIKIKTFEIEPDAMKIRFVHIPDNSNESRLMWWIFCQELK